MDEKLQKQLVRQLKLLNFWITTFGILLLVGLAIVGFLLYQVVSAVQNTADRIQNLQQSTSEQLNVKQQVCEGNNPLTTYLRDNGLCKDQQ